jgi:hypothetical protein
MQIPKIWIISISIILKMMFKISKMGHLPSPDLWRSIGIVVDLKGRMVICWDWFSILNGWCGFFVDFVSRDLLLICGDLLLTYGALNRTDMDFTNEWWLKIRLVAHGLTFGFGQHLRCKGNLWEVFAVFFKRCSRWSTLDTVYWLWTITGKRFMD